MFQYFLEGRDPISSYTHFLGACLSFIALVVMVSISMIHQNSALTTLSSAVFGFSLIALYSASAYYHYIDASSSTMDLFRKLDHTMIYVLIAGSYTPIVLHFMPIDKGIKFISVIWIAALVGIITKIAWLNAPRLFYTSLYLLMGWVIVLDMKSFVDIPRMCLALIACGGVSYTIGAIIYIRKKPNYSKLFGFHELFHLFIMVGSLFHVLTVILYVL